MRFLLVPTTRNGHGWGGLRSQGTSQLGGSDVALSIPIASGGWFVTCRWSLRVDALRIAREHVSPNYCHSKNVHCPIVGLRSVQERALSALR